LRAHGGRGSDACARPLCFALGDKVIRAR
jgi:hypothetical protein